MYNYGKYTGKMDDKRKEELIASLEIRKSFIIKGGGIVYIGIVN